LLLVPFKNIIKDEDKDYELESKVIANELPAILNFAIKGMQRLNQQGKFTEAIAMKEAMNSYKESSNHVATFIEEEQYEAVDEALKTGTSLIELFTAFKSWCNTHGHNPYSSSYLSHELENMGFIAYKNSSKHFRIIKNKLKNETGFEPNTDDDYE
jgi:phage/plasmid-associated DNA primase